MISFLYLVTYIAGITLLRIQISFGITTYIEIEYKDKKRPFFAEGQEATSSLWSYYGKTSLVLVLKIPISSRHLIILTVLLTIYLYNRLSKIINPIHLMCSFTQIEKNAYKHDNTVKPKILRYSYDFINQRVTHCIGYFTWLIAKLRIWVMMSFIV